MTALGMRAVLVLWLCVALRVPALAYEPPAVLRVALPDDNPPYSFVSATGEPRGFVRDMWEVWSQRTGVAISLQPMHWPAGAEMVKFGGADVIAAIPKGTADPSLRLSAVELAQVPYHVFYNRDIGEIGGVEDLAPFTVGVVAAGSCERFLRRNDVRHLRPYPSLPALAEAVARGEVGVFCGGRAVGLRALRRHDLDMEFKMSPLLYQGSIHWATRQWDGDLHQFVADGFARITQRERDEIASRWQGAERLSEVRRSTLRGLVYFLLAALAALGLGGAWILTLRRQVHAKSWEVRASEVRSAAILNALPELAWIKDLDGRYLAVNASLASMCGVTEADSMIGRFAYDFFPGELVEAHRRNDEQVIRRMEPLVVVEPMVGPGGAVRWIESSKAPFLDEAGRCIGVVGMSREITSRKETEDALGRALEALQANERRYRTMIGALPVGVFEVDRDGTILFANDHAWALLGLTPVEGSVEPWVNLIHPEDNPAAIVALRSLLTRGKPLRLEVRLAGEDGGETWVQAVGVRNTDTEGAIVSILDISERRRAEDRLRARTEEFRILAEHSPDTIARYDREARRVYANPALIAAADLEPEQMLGLTPGETFRTAEAWAYDARIREVAESGRGDVYELLWQGGGGAPVISEIRLVPEFGRAGTITGVIGIGRDVTRLKQVEDELRAKTETLAAVLENLPGNAFTLRYCADGSRHLLYSSLPETAAAAIPPGEDARQRFHPDDHDLLFKQVPERLRLWGYSEHKFRLMAETGVPIWMHARERVRERRDGDMIVDGMVFDITAEVVARQHLEDSERQRLRAEARLQQGRRFEALGQFAGGIAHDFNNLLGAMLGYARFIEEDTPPDCATHHHAARIVAVGNRGRAIVEQILNYTRRMDLSLGRFAIGDLLGEVVSFCAVGCPEGVTLQAEPEAADLEIQADRLQLMRTLMNLCVNARDAMEGRTGTIRIGAHQAEIDSSALRRLVERDDCGDHGDVEAWGDEDGTAWAVAGRLPKVLPHVTLYVADSGGGMDAKLLENAFQPFFSTKDRSRGAGLGLAVVLGVVTAHGGALVARAKPGEGSRFDLLLPVHHSAAQPVDMFVPVCG